MASTELRADAHYEPVSVVDLQQALVETDLIDPDAINDPDGYDAGFTVTQIDALHERLFKTKSVQERNFCPRCGKRTNGIHTCTPPAPLTDQVIAELWHKNGGFHHHFARAIERWLRGHA